ncbi:MAG: hypothetical protein DLM61_10510 [Pseudonocardiales bacterium]|nr:MAG: hypothetical protein DLM61_10510 [Pseudonocardiales bacterium]
MAGVCGGGLGGGVDGQQQGADLFELDRSGVQRRAIVGGQSSGVRGRSGGAGAVDLGGQFGEPAGVATRPPRPLAGLA